MARLDEQDGSTRGTITIINNSSFADYSAIMRVGRLIAGDEYYALHDEHGKAVNVKK